jgi:EmrB/QacA subfamily drug resistance transporter
MTRSIQLSPDEAEDEDQLVPFRTINQKIAVPVVYAGAMFIAVMDITIVNVALPTIARSFQAPPASVAAVVIGYQVSFAVFIPASSWLGDRFGARQVLLGAITIFTMASALCGLAGSLSELVAFRVLQGAGGGLMVPVGLAMLFRVFPPAERVRAAGILIVPTALAPAIGPIIGGLFVTHLSWRWVFYVNVPIGAVALLFGLIFLADQRPTRVGRFDIAGLVSSGLGFGLLMYGLSEGPNIGWAARKVLLSIVVGGTMLIVMVVIELRTAEPLLDLRLYGNRLFRATSIAMTLTSVAFFGLLYLLALFLQDGLHLNALQAGLTIFPEAVGVMVGSQFISRLLYPTLGPRRIMVTGLVVMAALMGVLSRVDTGTSLWVIRSVLFFVGLSVSAVFLPSQAAAFATIPISKTGVASTVFNAQRQLGGAIGVAILTSAIVALDPLHIAGHTVTNVHAYQDGLLVAAGIALLGALAALFVHDADAASTMVPVRRRTQRVAEAPEVAGIEPG